MANNNQFQLFITCVDSVGPLLKLWGQSDQTSMVFIERFLLQLTPDFEKGHYVPNIANLKVGQLCVGKYNDGVYYRAKILNLSQIRDGLILVHFIDHGNTESLPLTSIRVVDGSSPLTSFVPLANEYIISGVINASQTWSSSTFEMLTNMVCNMELNAVSIASVGPYKIISVQFNNDDLSKLLINFNVVIPCSINTQAQILAQKLNQGNQPSLTSTTDSQNNHSHISPNSKSSYSVPRRTSAPTPGVSLVDESPAVFKNTILPIHSEHLVTVSAVEDGPKSFTLQIQSWEKYLNKLMMDLNTLFTVSLSEIPVPGTLCIALNSLNRSLCRAVITQVIDDKCKVYFVDFGNSEIIPYAELYQLPPTLISPKILALRFSLSNLKSINITSELKSSFKDFVMGKTLKLRVMAPEGPPVLQYGELFDEKGVNVLTILKTTLGLEVLKFRQMGKQETDCIADVSVTYVKTCQEFYVHFLSDIDALNRLMSDLNTHCEQNQNNLSRNRIQIGMACCALFTDDAQWYRAEVLGFSGNDIHVKYIDFGNDGVVNIQQIKDIPIELVNRLPVQALRGCLVGYENEPVNQSLSNTFENIALENNYTMKIIKYHTPQVLLVDLIDMSTRLFITNTLLEAQKKAPDVIPQVPHCSPPLSNVGAGDSNYFDSKKKSRNRIEETPPRFRKKENVHGKSISDRLQRRLSPKVPLRDDENVKAKFRNNENSRPDFNKNRPPHSTTSPNYNDRHSRNDGNKKNDKWNDKSPSKKPSWNDSKKENSWNDSKKDNSWNDSKKENSWNDSKRDNSWKDSKKDNSWKDSKKDNSWNDTKKDNSWNDSKKDNSWNDSKKKNSWNDSKRESRNDFKKPNPSWNDSNKEGKNESRKENFQKREPRRDNRKDFKKEPYVKSDSDSNSERRFDRTKKNFNNKSPSKFDGRKRADSRSSDKSDTSFRKKRFEKPRSSNIPYTAPPANYANLNDKYTELDYPEGSIENVNISWFYNPKHFYIQITSMESQFKKMMTEIQKMYKNRNSVQDAIPAGSSVIAHFSEDNFLYRATVLDVRLDKYKVRYIDYGNTNFVDKNKIWQVEKQFMELPVQSIVCTLPEIYPAGETWNDSSEMDNCFNKGNYQCVFHAEYVDNKRVVSLSHSGLLITEDLIHRGLATSNASTTNEPLNDSNISQHIPGIEHDIEDAPVDLGLLQEQKLRITISCAYGLERFYVYLNKSKTENVLKHINDYGKEHNSTLEPLAAEKIVNGTVCLTQTESGWQRCIISNAAATNGIYVNFPDIGGGEEISSEKLFNLPIELTGYYYQTIECGLYNYHLGCTQNISDEEFQSKYEKNELIAYVNEVQNERLLVTLYDCNGNKLLLIKDEESDKNYLTVSPLCPMSVLNGNLKVRITHINTYDSLYIQRVADSDQVIELLNSLRKHYENNTDNITHSDITINELCAVKLQDGNWYRGRVLIINDDASINIIYIDYGNQETVNINSVRKLDPIFYTINEYALHVALPLSAENDITEDLKQLTNEQEFYSKLAYTEGCWYIELYSEDVALSSHLIESGVANKLDFDPFRRRFEIISDSNNTNDKIILYIAHADSPNQFYAQLLNDENSINALQEELENLIPTLSDLQSPDAGVLCAAKYSADDIWYRAEVLDADDQITTVRFIDYGNTDVLDNSSGVIKTLPIHMLTIDRYAKKCSLDLTPVGEEWSQIACEMFEQKLVGQICQANVLYQDKGIMYVTLYVNDENITESLINEGYGKPLNLDLEDELSNKTGFISHINSINEFWIQLESSCADLEMVSDQLSIADKFPDLSDKRPGVLCAARFPDDNDWYRARILSSVNDENVTQVLFIDYGNSSTTTELKMLPEQVINIRALALKCSLLKPLDIEEWPSDFTDKFRELAADGATIFDVKVVTTGETSVVELSIDNLNIIEILLPKTKSFTTTAVISHVLSPESFWIQLSENANILENIFKKLTNINNLTKVENPVESTIYIVQFPEDNLWYRAILKSKSESSNKGYQVCLIDNGNSCVTQEIHHCPDDLASIEPLAKHCCLKNSDDNSPWRNAEATATLIELSDYGNTTFEVKFLNSEEPALVSLYWEGQDVSLAINVIDENEEDILDKNEEEILDKNEEILDKNQKDILDKSEEDILDKNEEDILEKNEEIKPHETCRKIIDAISAATNLNVQSLPQSDEQEKTKNATNELNTKTSKSFENEIHNLENDYKLEEIENKTKESKISVVHETLEQEIIVNNNIENTSAKDLTENIQFDINKIEESRKSDGNDLDCIEGISKSESDLVKKNPNQDDDQSKIKENIPAEIECISNIEENNENSTEIQGKKDNNDSIISTTTTEMEEGNITDCENISK